MDAVDRDPTAITHACKWHAHPKINLVEADAIKDGFLYQGAEKLLLTIPLAPSWKERGRICI